MGNYYKFIEICKKTGVKRVYADDHYAGLLSHVWIQAKKGTPHRDNVEISLTIWNEAHFHALKAMLKSENIDLIDYRGLNIHHGITLKSSREK